MSPVGTSYPPPLSAPPSVETLERLLTGLHRPMEPGVPTPPTASDTSELLFGDVPRPARPRAAEEATAPPPRAGLTWSAGGYHPHRLLGHRRTAPPLAGAVAAAAAALLAILAATGDVGLP